MYFYAKKYSQEVIAKYRITFFPVFNTVQYLKKNSVIYVDTANP
jgi:hypothetical protein